MITQKFKDLLINNTQELQQIATKDKVYHFIGIGGCGMSGIAKVMLQSGYKVQGSDAKESDYTKQLRDISKDIKIFIGQAYENVSGADIVVYSDSIHDDNPEMQYVLDNNIKIVPRAVMLDFIINDNNKKSIAITGTHGKTTTTSFASILLKESDKNPTFINGGIINQYNTNAENGSGEYSAYEACEAYGNVKYFNQSISVITNIEPEHMDFYKTNEILMDYFYNFVKRTKDLCIIGLDTEMSLDLYKMVNKSDDIKATIKTFSLNNTNADIHAENILQSITGVEFTAVIKSDTEEERINIQMPIFGEHNIKNALPIIIIAKHIGLSNETIQKACKSFTGNKHRFSLVDKFDNITIIDDYGHHPSEISSVIETAKQILKKDENLIVLFEPHKYSRLSDCWDGFKQIFSNVKNFIITDVYDAGETPIENINSTKFVAELSSKTNAFHVNSFSEIAQCINGICQKTGGGTIISFSAGALKDYIYSLPEQIKKLKKV